MSTTQTEKKCESCAPNSSHSWNVSNTNWNPSFPNCWWQLFGSTKVLKHWHSFWFYLRHGSKIMASSNNKKAYQLVGQCETRRHSSQWLSSMILVITCSENVHAWPCIDWHGQVLPWQQYDTSHLCNAQEYNEKISISHLRNEPQCFRVKEQKCLKGYTIGNEDSESQFPKLLTFSKSVEPLLRNCDPNMTKNEHAYAICCRPEVARDVIASAM